MKVFISMPMRDKTKEQILKERKEIENKLKLMYNNVQIIDSYIDNNDNHVYCLGEAIKRLSEADMCYFADGWHKARGCKIEHLVCVEYGIKKMYY